MSGSEQQRRATLIGFLAVPIWASLPLLTVLAGAVPPMQLVAMTFTLGTVVGLLFVSANKSAASALRSVTSLSIAVGIGGLFVYHFSYFLALQNAPAVEASLVNYLWPVLIVLFSTALPGRANPGRLTIWHVAGAVIAFAGAALAITGGERLSLSGNGFGYSMALVAAFVWSSYSVATRLFRNVSSAAVTFHCAGTAALAWLGHFFLEPTVVPVSGLQAAAIVALGLGPVGAAFYVWDYGCKQGDLRVLGVAAYFAPVLSTGLLIISGIASARPALWFAAVLITVGALLAGKQLILQAIFGKGLKAKA